MTNNAWNSQNPAQVARGGTGQNNLTAYHVIVGQGANPVSFAQPTLVHGVPLVSNGAAVDPSFDTAEVVGGGTGLQITVPYSVLCSGDTATAKLHCIDTTGIAGQVLTSNGTTWPSWQDLGSAGTAEGRGNYLFRVTAVLAANATGDGTDVRLTQTDPAFVWSNYGNVWDLTNSQWKAPVNGLFWFSVKVYFSGAALGTPDPSNVQYQLRLHGVQTLYSYDQYPIPQSTYETDTSRALLINAIVKANANDIIYFSFMADGFGGKVVMGDAYSSYINGCLISRF